MVLRRAPVIAFALMSVCLGAPSASRGASAAEPPITVEGNRLVDAEKIRSHVHRAPGGDFRAEEIDAALKALYATHLFKDVQIERTGAGLRIKVVENPIIGRIAFEGNKALKDENLKTLVESKEGGSLSEPLIHDDVARIIDAYRRRGRFNATVTPKTIAEKSGRASLVFEIKEGERTGIRKIEFIGNTVFSANRLRGIIKSRQTSLLSFLFDDDFYDSDTVELDRDLLARFYRAHGYPDARVVAAVPRYDSASKGFVLTFTVYEGARYRFGNVAIRSGLRGINVAKLEDSVQTRQGDVFNADAIDGSVDALLMQIARHGEPFASVRPVIERVLGQPIVNVNYTIEPGPRIYVERIDIHGNTKTLDDVIRRELAFSEGGPLNRAMIKISERRLKRLGFFKTVKFTEKPGSASDRVVVDVQVAEEKTGNVSFGGGYSTVDGLMANVSVSEHNLLGRGIAGKIAVDYGQYTRAFDLALIRPYAFDQRITLGFDLYAKQTDSSSYQAYSSAFYGTRFDVTTPLSDELALLWRYSLSNQSLTLDPSRGTASLPVQDAAAAGPQWVSALGSTIRYDTLDDPRRPTSGIHADINNDVAGLGGDVKYLRNTDDVRFYHPINADLIGMGRVQTGYITPWGGQSLPLLNGFFGGPNLVRGFAPNGFGPRDIAPGTTMDNIGGNAYWATSTELQTPITVLPPEVPLRVAAFADAGSLWGTGVSSFGPALSQSLQVSNSKAIRSSIGVGLIWDSFFGPLRVDYAYPLTKGSYDITQRLHFGYGPF